MTLVRSLNPATGETEVSEIRDRTLPGSAFQPGAPGGGLPILTTTARNALVGGYLYRGLTILNATTGAVEVYYGAVTGWRPPWNVAWGEVGYVETTSNTIGVTSTPVDVTGATVTVTAIGGRKWSVIGKAMGVSPSANTALNLYLLEAGVSIDQGGAALPFYAVSGTAVVAIKRVVVAGSVTYKLQASSNTGTLQVQGTTGIAATIFITDIGPSGSAPTS